MRFRNISLRQRVSRLWSLRTPRSGRLAPLSYPYSGIYQTRVARFYFPHQVLLTHSSLRYGFYFVEQLLGFGVIGYGIFAGIQLWSVRPGAIKHAQQFMIALVAYSLADFVMAANWAVLMDPQGTFERFSSWVALKPVVATAAYGAIWYSYLLKSKRVQITYSLQGPLEKRLR